MTKTKTRTKTRTKVAVAVGGAAIAAAAVVMNFAAPRLIVTISDATPEADIIIGSSQDVPVSTFTFRSRRHDHVVEKITLSNCLIPSQDLDGDCADAGEQPGNDQIVDVLRIFYQDEFGNEEEESGYLVDGDVVFDNLELYVPAGEERDLVVMIDAHLEGNEGAYSGDWIRLNFNARASEDRFSALDIVNERTLTQDDMNKYVMAKPMQLRRSQPEFSLFGGTPSGAAMPELIEVLIFDIAADSGGDVSIRELVFDINTTDNAGTGWNVCDLDESMGGMTDDHFLLYDMDNPGQALNGYGSASWTFLAEDMTVCTEDTDVIKYAVLEFDPSYMGEVAAGSIDTYQLYVDTSGASAATDDSIRVDIPPEVTVQDNGADDPDGVVIWEDHDAYEEDGAQFIDGHFIESLPLTGGTIIF